MVVDGTRADSRCWGVNTELGRLGVGNDGGRHSGGCTRAFCLVSDGLHSKILGNKIWGSLAFGLFLLGESFGLRSLPLGLCSRPFDFRSPESGLRSPESGLRCLLFRLCSQPKSLRESNILLCFGPPFFSLIHFRVCALHLNLAWFLIPASPGSISILAAVFP